MTTASDIEAAAADWLVRLDGLDKSGPMPVEFTAWCERDPRHRAAYLRLEVAWRKADRLSHLRVLGETVDVDLLASTAGGATPLEVAANSRAASSQSVRSPGERGRALFRFWPVAASVMLFAISLVAWVVLDQRGQVYRTGIGGFERIVLEDGSAVALNTNSEIRVRFKSDRRTISLISGQAHFKVAHDVHRPFDVIAGATIVRAVGTAFAVRLRDQQQVEVLVEEGRVAVAPLELDLKSVGLPPFLPTLGAGEVAVIKPSMPVLETQKIESQAINRRLAWKDGWLIFEGQTLREAVAEFNRYNQKQLSIADPSIAELRVGGSFDATDPESFVVALEKSFGVRASASDPAGIALVRSAQ